MFFFIYLQTKIIVVKNRIMTRKNLKATLLIFLMIFANSVFAQGPPPPPPPIETPIDGGILALVIAGIAYAVKVIRDKK